MQMNTLTDDELRRLIETEPENLNAMREGAARFVDRADEVRMLEDRIEELEQEVGNLNRELYDERMAADA